MVHEWALAEAVLATASRAAGGKIVKSLKVVLGELQNVDVEILRFAISELKRGTDLEAAEVEFEVEPAVFKCEVCGTEWRLDDALLNDREREAIHFVPELAHAFLKCTSCGSPDFRVVKGRGVWIKELVSNG
ncbi:MAG: hydrogenase nickel incorporation protein HypA [Thermofilaceae archaeon]|nr:hydrogenase nickel incorporation protein HypA [Thermofilaceae archaeon]MCX8179874.1 hydrogenase nickel incorporation protein HypA [Thermofilaceae archaeon]MDW8004441.1 hydrogenase nickel incorporation protein HypA [Thermofilaceae archaeon]